MAHVSALPNQDRLRVLAIDSSAMSTQLLVEALARDEQFQIIECAFGTTALLPFIKREKPHVAVIGANLGEKAQGTFELIREISTQLLDTRVVVMLDSSERAAVVEAFRAGAKGLFCRTEPFRLLAKCIKCVHMGQVWAGSNELQFVLQALAQPALAHFRADGGSLLSAREIDVVRCISEGLTNREIAERLKLSEHTVKNYLFRIFDKLGVSNRVEVALHALGSGAASRLTADLPTSAPTPLPNKSAVRPSAVIRKMAAPMSQSRSLPFDPRATEANGS